MDEAVYLLSLQNKQGVGGVTLRKLIDEYLVRSGCRNQQPKIVRREDGAVRLLLEGEFLNRLSAEDRIDHRWQRRRCDDKIEVSNLIEPGQFDTVCAVDKVIRKNMQRIGLGRYGNDIDRSFAARRRLVAIKVCHSP